MSDAGFSRVPPGWSAKPIRISSSPARLNSVSALGKAEQSGLSFLRTPGPGDSEGGELYPPTTPMGRGVRG